MKKVILILLVITTLISFCSCNSVASNNTDNKAAEGGKTHTVTDHSGYSINVPDKIERIVVCDIFPLPSILSVFFDSADKLVGINKTSMSAAENSLLSELYPDILKAKVDFISGTDVNIEELTLLSPDIVFYSSSSVQLGTKLRNAGFAAIGVSANKWEYNAIETLNNWMKLLGEIFPENEKYKIVQEYSNSVYDLVQSRIKDIPENRKKRVFFLFQYNESTLLTSGRQFFGQFWADATGAINAAEELTADNSAPVGMEQVLAWNPDMIFITNFTPALPEDLYDNKIGNFDWSAIEAVKNRQVYKMPLGMYRSYTPGVDTPVTLMWFAKTTYPELFEDIDITEETKKYYREVFGITLTDEQADRIFSPAAVEVDSLL